VSLRENIRFAVQRASGRRKSCAHVDQVRDVEPDSTEGCPECLPVGDRWVHLRMCMVCGHVGCCDSSKNTHASKHAHAAGHPIMRSLEAGEAWMWCVVDKRMVEPPPAARG
jgi:uncharacterized UBP type Zn finger protein